MAHSSNASGGASRATEAPGGKSRGPAASEQDASSTQEATYEDRGDAGYKQSPGNLQIQMIAVGGAIGVGLFLGYRRAVARGDAHVVDFRLPGAPVTTWICIVSLVAVALYVMLDFSSANWYYNLVAGVLMLVGTNVGYEISRQRLARNGLPDLGEGADD